MRARPRETGAARWLARSAALSARRVSCLRWVLGINGRSLWRWLSNDETERGPVATAARQESRAAARQRTGRGGVCARRKKAKEREKKKNLAPDGNHLSSIS